MRAKIVLIPFLLAALWGLTLSAPAHAQWGGGYGAWHGSYYHPAWGQPVALVTPPTVRWQSHYSWGVANTRVTPIRHQFGRFRGASAGSRFLASPAWPSSTDQLGVYPVRAPW